MEAVLVLGSNTGNRQGFILDAIRFLEGCGRIIHKTDIYESPDCLGSGRRYMNAVVVLLSSLDEAALNCRLKAFEAACGRDDNCRLQGLVPIDIDIVVCDGVVRRPDDFNASYFRKGFSGIMSEKPYNKF